MITHVSIRNYKSLANVEVDLGPLTVLVGQNGTGKSNFVDVVRFVGDILSVGLSKAYIQRDFGGHITAKGPVDHDSDIVIGFTFNFDGKRGEFSISLPRDESNDELVFFEKCVLDGKGYEVRNGRVISLPTNEPNEIVGQEAVFLPLLAARFSVTPVLDFLSNAERYRILPAEVRTPKPTTSSSRLGEYGSNLGPVLKKIREKSQEDLDRIVDRLHQVVPDITGLDSFELIGYEVVTVDHEFSTETGFRANLAEESDGTLRLLGILAALHQYPRLKLLTFEEPELMIHPGALSVLSEEIKEASLQSQIIITTHSPDLVSEFSPDQIRVVDKVDGATQVSSLDEGQVEAIRQKLFSAGELMLIEGLRPHSQGSQAK